MKNLSSLLVRLGALSLAAAMVFSVAQAAVRKDTKTVDAVLEMISKQQVDNSVEPTRAQPAALASFRNVSASSLNPMTQQFKIGFSDKSTASRGAFVSLDFAITATSYRLGLADNGLATVAVHIPMLYVHPQMTAERIMGQIVNASSNIFTVTCMQVNPYIAGSRSNAQASNYTTDFRLTPTVRVNAITRDVYIGFVPMSLRFQNTTLTCTPFYGQPVPGGTNVGGIYNGYTAFTPGTVNGAANLAQIRQYASTCPCPIYGGTGTPGTSVASGSGASATVAGNVTLAGGSGFISWDVASDDAIVTAVVNATKDQYDITASVAAALQTLSASSNLTALSELFGTDNSGSDNSTRLRDFVLAHGADLARAFRTE